MKKWSMYALSAAAVGVHFTAEKISRDITLETIRIRTNRNIIARFAARSLEESCIDVFMRTIAQVIQLIYSSRLETN